MTPEEVKQIIDNSKFDASLKKRLLSVLPRLGKNTLSGLGREVSRGDSVIIAEYIVSLWEGYADFLDGLKNKDADSFQKLLKYLDENLSRFNGEDELYFLDFVLDVRTQSENSKMNFSDDTYRKILNFEITLFWHLPIQEVMFLLDTHLLYLESKVNLLRHMQLATWENDWDYQKDFTQVFTEILMENKEDLGTRKVGDWVHDYFNFSSAAAFRKDSVQIAEFLVKNPDVQKLPADDRTKLSEILKLYVWLLQQEMNESEILDYKEQLTSTEPELWSKFLDATADQLTPTAEPPQQAPAPIVHKPPSIPAPKNTPQLKPFNEIKRLPTAGQGPVKELSLSKINPVIAKPLPKTRVFPPSSSGVNIHDLLRNKEVTSGSDHTPGLRMGAAGQNTIQKPAATNIADPKPQSTNPARAQIQKPGPSQVEIDKKLEDLEKRVE